MNNRIKQRFSNQNQKQLMTKIMTNNNNKFPGQLLGDQGLLGDDDADNELMQAGDDEAMITLPNGTSVKVPLESLGDMFTGDDEDMDGDLYGDVDSLLGDSEIVNLGDMFTGDSKKKIKFGSMLPKGRPMKGASSAAKNTVRVLNQIPGAVLSTKVLSPVIINKGLINNAPTRAMIQGASFLETIKRFETQYPGTTRTQIQASSPPNPVFTFAAPTLAEGGNTLWAPVIFIQLVTQRQFSVSNAEIRLSISGFNESGAAVDSRQWTILLSDALESCFFAVVPFTEISSTIYPGIVQGSSVSNLVVNLFGIPTNTNVRVVLPGPDSSQYQLFKEGLGIAKPTRKIIDPTTQK